MRPVLLFLALVPWAFAASPQGDAPQKKTAKARAPGPSRLEIAAMQIALDDDGFSPGPIDGRDGPRMTNALAAARAAGRKIVPTADPWTLWKVPDDIGVGIGPVPEGWVARSKLTAMSYERISEQIAERFHISEDFLQFLNPDVTDWSSLKGGEELKVPALNRRRLPAADHLTIKLSAKMIQAHDAQDQVLASFPCSIASRKEKRPVGKLQVRVMASDPDYLFDPKLFEESPDAKTIRSKLRIPPGPNNPVGVMWIGLDRPGYGIHGTPLPEDIGKTQSHGCFRLTNWDARRLARMIKIGTPVWIEE